METLLQDLRFALRSLARSRGFALVAVLCLALGIGANTAMFSVVNTLLFRPLPFEEPDRIVMVYTARPAQGIDGGSLSPAEVEDVRAGTRALSVVAGSYGRNFSVAGEGAAERVEGQAVTHQLFTVLGVRPLLGRGFLPEEDRPGAGPVAILGHDLWQRRFGGRRDVIGRAVTINGDPHTVVGVMPPRFAFPARQEIWVPAREDATERRDRYLWTVGKLAPGATVEEARAELAALGRRLAERHPAESRGWVLGAKPFREEFVSGELPLMLSAMMGAVGFVLLIACANLANLLLARAAARRREVAIRTALGAGRWRIVRQLLTESVLLALAGGMGGTLIAVWWVDWVVRRIPERMAYWMEWGVDGRVLVYTLALSVGTGLVFGTLPALRASRADLQGDLKDGGRAGEGAGRSRLRSTLVAGEIALSVVLLVGAGLMIRSFLAMSHADPGFDERGLLSMRVYLAGTRFDDVAAKEAFLRQARERIEALPGVRAAAATSAIPTDDGGAGTTLVAEGQPSVPGEEPMGTVVASGEGLFAALGTPLLAGRGFTAREVADTAARVVVVSRALAERLWPGRSAVGRRLHLGFAPEEPWFTVVGVAPTLHYEELAEATPTSALQVHLPYARTGGWRTMALLVRTTGDPAAVAGAVRRELRGLDPAVALYDVRTMPEVRAFTTWPWRLYGELFGSFAGVALLLAAVGVYGVMAYSVSQRRREIGIRLALGASGGEVQRMVVGQGAVLAALGVGAGLVGAFAVSRLLAGVLYGVSPNDPAAFALTVAVLASAALLASWIPARRAARVDPMTALRAE